jgi:hypothetical protein
MSSTRATRPAKRRSNFLACVAFADISLEVEEVVGQMCRFPREGSGLGRMPAWPTPARLLLLDNE